MPVEIRELVIKANIQEEGNRPASAGAGAQAMNVNKEAIVKAAVDEVLRILKEKQSR